MKIFSPELVSDLQKSGATVDGNKLFLNREILETYLEVETKFPLLNTLKRKVVKGKVGTAVNTLALTSGVGLTNSRKADGTLTAKTKGRVVGRNKTVDLEPFEYTLVIDWFEKVELSSEKERLNKLVEKLLVIDSYIIALASVMTAEKEGRLDQFDGIFESATKVNTGTDWVTIIDGVIDTYNLVSSDNTVDIYVPLSKEGEVYKQLISTNLISEDRYNNQGTYKYRTFNIKYDGGLDLASKEGGLSTDFAILVHPESLVLFHADNVKFTEIDNGSTEEVFIGTYFAPAITNPEFIVLSKKVTGV